LKRGKKNRKKLRGRGQNGDTNGNSPKREWGIVNMGWDVQVASDKTGKTVWTGGRGRPTSTKPGFSV